MAAAAAADAVVVVDTIVGAALLLVVEARITVAVALSEVGELWRRRFWCCRSYQWRSSCDCCGCGMALLVS